MRSARFWRIALVGLVCANLGAEAIAHSPFRANHVIRERARHGNWQLDIARDRFSGAVACKLWSRDGRTIYRSGAVGFQFYGLPQVTDAVYRIDGGEARVSRDDLPRLMQLGTPVDHGPMTDPTNGLVWVPYDLVAHARSIAIEPRPGGHVTVFGFDGLGALHDRALAGGCTPESRFVAK